MLIYTHQKSKKRKRINAKERELKSSWEELMKKHPPKNVSTKNSVVPKIEPKKYVRETPKYPSLNTGGAPCTKPIHGKVYTGTAMKGIGTLHKSNAVPIFTNEEAIDQANMRR